MERKYVIKFFACSVKENTLEYLLHTSSLWGLFSYHFNSHIHNCILINFTHSSLWLKWRHRIYFLRLFSTKLLAVHFFLFCIQKCILYTVYLWSLLVCSATPIRRSAGTSKVGFNYSLLYFRRQNTKEITFTALCCCISYFYIWYLKVFYAIRLRAHFDYFSLNRAAMRAQAIRLLSHHWTDSCDVSQVLFM